MKRSYRQRDLKLLWSRSGGICSFPGCTEFLSQPDSLNIIGEIAHIVALSSEGPRGDSAFPASKINTYENLILLCPTHHGIVDAPHSLWTVADIIKMKGDHEEWVRRRLSIGEPWTSNLSNIHYLNVPRLAILAAQQGMDVDLPYIDSSRSLHSLGWELARILGQFKALLSAIEPRAIPLDKTIEANDNLIGITLSFNTNFRTKGVPSPSKADSYQLSGCLAKDPHIYKKSSFGLIAMVINPKWITTTTAFVSLSPSGGHARLSGLCTVNQWDQNSETLLATPLILGNPRSPLEGFLGFSI